MKLSNRCLTSMVWNIRNSSRHRRDAMRRFICTAAVDPAEFDRVYTQTDVLIEVMEDDIEKEGETK